MRKTVFFLVVVLALGLSASAFAQQPPVGQRTIRTYITTPSGDYSSESRDAIRINGMRVGFWGQPCCPINKGPAIQKWSCRGSVVYNAIFSSEAEARRFLNSPQQEAIAARWRVTLDNTPAQPDPSSPGAMQVFLPMQ